ncbi:Adenosine-5'-phosphosulfate kinase [Klebsormidium nitens]|uniref:Adenylyl-sulfate kinase n=1 Tax=Klebsormidium nitens TaxID=105231 RepID=A0A1Y1IKP7_KLENI|nr:Adenosine-5'-phosphosulfate kinase [Klebsormidium nitens]|eukprot:GAQ91445.1 Adenosine-5'-phosphosulfate kinase [Klebsormidium nitens]
MQAATRLCQKAALCPFEARERCPRRRSTGVQTPSIRCQLPGNVANPSKDPSGGLQQTEQQKIPRGSALRASPLAEALPVPKELEEAAVKKPNGVAKGSVDGSKPGKTILEPCYTINQSTNILWHETMTSRPDREELLGQKGCVLWMTGLSGSGKSTLAYTLDHALNKMGRLSYVLDGDNIRHGLCNNLSFCSEDRTENNRRVAEVAKLFADCGVITIVSFISPYIKDREKCRSLLGPGEFIEVYLKTSIEVCEGRDPKGLYKKARAGIIKGFTGIDDPYEEPLNPEVLLNASAMTPEEMASHLLAYLENKGMLQPYCK